jgi:hypothetical protein
MRQPTIHQMREKKNHRGEVKDVERLQYVLYTYTYGEMIKYFKNNVLGSLHLLGLRLHSASFYCTHFDLPFWLIPQN